MKINDVLCGRDKLAPVMFRLMTAGVPHLNQSVANPITGNMKHSIEAIEQIANNFIDCGEKRVKRSFI